MARVSVPFGIKGWVKLKVFTETDDSLADYPVWWVERNGQSVPMQVEGFEVKPNGVLAKLKGVDDRTTAETLRFAAISIPREELPEIESDGEMYQADMLGFAVETLAGEVLGTVTGFIETGANDVMVVADNDSERLLPAVDAVIKEVDRDARKVRVDWGKDW